MNENSKPIIVSLADVKAESIEWLWRDRIALGKLTLIAGDPGLGKSFLSLAIAAIVSNGGVWPDGAAGDSKPGSIVLLGAEDGLADTIKPRLDAAGANCSKISALVAIQRRVTAGGDPEEHTLNLQRDIAHIEDLILRINDVRLVVIDPITAYMGKIDSHKNAEVRSVLAPLTAMAERHKVAILGITHLNKSDATNALYRMTGSLAFVAAARTAWLVAEDPEDEDRRLMLPVKNNIAPKTAGLAFRVQEGRVVWDAGEISVGANEALSGEVAEGGSRIDEAMDWLRWQLHDGPQQQKSIQQKARSAGISDTTLNRAKRKLKVIARREGFGRNSYWAWYYAPKETNPLTPPDQMTTFGASPYRISTPAKMTNDHLRADDDHLHDPAKMVTTSEDGHEDGQANNLTTFDSHTHKPHRWSSSSKMVKGEDGEERGDDYEAVERTAIAEVGM